MRHTLYIALVIHCVLLTADFQNCFAQSQVVKPDTCWAQNIDAPDGMWKGFYTPDISSIAILKDGYVVGGYLANPLFKNRTVPDGARQIWTGDYIARYDNSGNNLWVAHGNIVDYGGMFNANPSVSAVAVTPKGDILAYGTSKRGAKWYGPNDEVTDVVTYPQLYYVTNADAYLIKLDANGKPKWHTTFPGGTARNIAIDAHGSLYITGVADIFFVLQSNGTTLDTLFNFEKAGFNYLLKLDSNGKLLWKTYIEENHVNRGGCTNLAVDSAGNVFVSGVFEVRTVFHSSDGSAQDSLKYNGQYGGNGYLVKYDSSGRFLWKLHTGMQKANGKSAALSVAVDRTGNAYLSGENMSSYAVDTMLVTNADKSEYLSTNGCAFLLKVNPAGNVVWDNGFSHSDMGASYGVVLHRQEVSIVGYVQRRKSDTCNGIMSSTDGHSKTLSPTNSEYFLACFDTSGVLCYVATTGTAANTLSREDDAAPMVRDAEGNHLFVANVWRYSGVVQFSMVDDSLLLNGIDGIVVKIGNSPCSNVYYATAVEDDTEISDMSAFPIPGRRDYVNVCYTGGVAQKLKLQVVALDGEVLYEDMRTSRAGRNCETLHPRWLSSGLYILRLSSPTFVHCLKLLVQ